MLHVVMAEFSILCGFVLRQRYVHPLAVACSIDPGPSIIPPPIMHCRLSVSGLIEHPVFPSDAFNHTRHQMTLERLAPTIRCLQDVGHTRAPQPMRSCSPMSAASSVLRRRVESSKGRIRPSLSGCEWNPPNSRILGAPHPSVPRSPAPSNVLMLYTPLSAQKHGLIRDPAFLARLWATSNTRMPCPAIAAFDAHH